MAVYPVIRVTAGGAWRITGDGAIRIIGYHVVPKFDVAAAIDIYFPGIVVQRNLTEAVSEWLVDHDGEISEANVSAILARANVLLADDVVAPYAPTTQNFYPLALPPYPTGLPRFPDSNPAPDGWSITTDEKVVHGGRL